MRGDDPNANDLYEEMKDVCPACAGMIHRIIPINPEQFGLPRMRGDDPAWPPLRTDPSEFAPHARG